MREIVDMPDKKTAQFILFTQQNNGEFPKTRRSMFQELSDEEIVSLTKVVRDVLLPAAEQKQAFCDDGTPSVQFFSLEHA